MVTILPFNPLIIYISILQIYKHLHQGNRENPHIPCPSERTVMLNKSSRCNVILILCAEGHGYKYEERFMIDIYLND